MTLHFDPEAFAYGSLASDRLTFARGFRPARRLGPLKAVADTINVPTGVGMSGVPFDWSRVPYFRGVAEAFADPEFEMVALMGGAQIVGKTAFLLAMALGYCGLAQGADATIVHFSTAKAREMSAQKLDRMIRVSPDLRRALDLSPGKDNVYDKAWRSGAYLRITWPTVENLSSSDLPFLLLTDRDRMPDTLLGATELSKKRKAEGAPEELALNRTRSFDDEGCVLVESTPGRENHDPTWKQKPGSHAMAPVGGIAGIYNSADRRRYHVPCPHCMEAFEPSHTLLNPGRSGDLMTRSLAVTMTCPNGCVIKPSQKMWMNLRGNHVAEGQTSSVETDVMHYGERLDAAVVVEGVPTHRTRRASFHIPATMASANNFPWADLWRLEAQALQTLETTGSEEPLRNFTLTTAAFPYTPKRVADFKPLDKESLRARAREQVKQTVPDFVRFLVTTVDVQSNRFVVQVHGYGPDLECAIVDRRNIRYSMREGEDGEKLPVSPGEFAEDWSLLTKELTRRYPLADGSGRRMEVAVTACDLHGVPGVTTNAVAYARKVFRDGFSKRFALFRGDPHAKKSLPIRMTRPDTSQRSDRKGATRGDVNIYQLNANYWKDAVSQALARPEPGPGYVHIPSWLGGWFFEEMTSEVRQEDGKWKKVKKANEAFDLLYMSRALLTPMRVDSENWDDPKRPCCLPRETNPYVFDGDDDTPARGTVSVWQGIRTAMTGGAPRG